MNQKLRTIIKLTFYLFLCMLLMVFIIPDTAVAGGIPDDSVEILLGQWHENPSFIGLYYVTGSISSNPHSMNFYAVDKESGEETALPIYSGSLSCNLQCTWENTLDLSALQPGNYLIKVIAAFAPGRAEDIYPEGPAGIHPECNSTSICIGG